jgi:ankyrin repeat protein
MKRTTRTIGNPNYQGPFGNTLLHGAVISGDVREVELLLAAGADPKIANREGQTALDAAAILGHEEIHKVLAQTA